MPRYDIVIHASVEVDCLSPEQAASIVKSCLLSGVDPKAVVRGLAAWSPHDGARATPLPGPHTEQLADFFDGVTWSAAMAEAVFRQEVARILAEAFPDGAPPEIEAGDDNAEDSAP